MAKYFRIAIESRWRFGDGLFTSDQSCSTTFLFFSSQNSIEMQTFDPFPTFSQSQTSSSSFLALIGHLTERIYRLGVCLHAHRMSVHVHTSPMVSSRAQPKNKEPLFYFYFFLLVPKTSLDQLVFYAFAKNYTFLRPQETFSNQRLFTFFGQQR